MRWRVILQFIAIVVMMAALYFSTLTPQRCRASMVVLNKIYTRTGDDGTRGARHRRAAAEVGPARFAAIGAIDELNAHVGLARLEADGDLDAMLARIQNDLFDLGADLRCRATRRDRASACASATAQVARLEGEIDASTPSWRRSPPSSFPAAAASPRRCISAGTVARRAEAPAGRSSTRRETLNPEALRYINRLSDFFFVAARFANRSRRRRRALGSRREPLSARWPSSRSMTPIRCATSAIPTSTWGCSSRSTSSIFFLVEQGGVRRADRRVGRRLRTDPGGVRPSRRAAGGLRLRAELADPPHLCLPPRRFLAPRSATWSSSGSSPTTSRTRSATSASSSSTASARSGARLRLRPLRRPNRRRR